MYKCCNKQARERARIVIGSMHFNALHCTACGEVMADLQWWERPLWWLLYPFWSGVVMISDKEVSSHDNK